MKRIFTLLLICVLLAPAESFAASKTLAATTTQTSISLKWTGATKKEKKNISGFAVFRNGKLVKKVSKQTTALTDKGLRAGTSYKYQIKTYKATKKKQWYNKKTKKWQSKKPAKKYRGASRKVYKYKNYTSTRKFTTKSVKPSNQETQLSAPEVSIRAQGDYALPVRVILSWKPVFIADKYMVYKGSEVFEVSSDDLMWTDAQVEWDTTYTYKVSAIQGNSEKISKEVSIKTPPKPLDLIAENGYYTDVSVMYDYINEWRQDPANHWYRDINNEIVHVNGDDLVILVRDERLEEIAKQRAKEQWIVYYEQNKSSYYKHTRPDGLPYSITVEEMGMTPITECTIDNLHPLNRREAIFGTSEFGHCDGWAETSAQYHEQGHRRAMLATGPNVKKVGFGAFRVGNTELIAMELAY